MEVYPDVHQFRIPLSDRADGMAASINMYLIKTDAGHVVVDGGVNSATGVRVATAQFAGAGASMRDIKFIVVTHSHYDHCGLVGMMCERSEAQVIIHESEAAASDATKTSAQDAARRLEEWVRDVKTWLVANGLPVAFTRDDGSVPRDAIDGFLPRVDRLVSGGEHILLGGLDLEIIWTPGHSPGHICLWDSHRRLLFSGDHVIPDTSPIVGLYGPEGGDPLGDYLSSLAHLSTLPAQLVLPGHHDVFSDLPGRIRELQSHHEARVAELLAACSGSRHTAFELTFGRDWLSTLDDSKANAYIMGAVMSSTLARLELLVRRGALTRTFEDGTYWYAPTS